MKTTATKVELKVLAGNFSWQSGFHQSEKRGLL